MPQGLRQYQMAVALPGQRMSYQDYTHGHGDFDECINGENSVIPYGRFVTDTVPASITTAQPVGSLFLPQDAGDNIVGFVQQQGYHEVNALGNVGVPSKFPMNYRYKGAYASESLGVIARGAVLGVAADPTLPADNGKLVDAGTYAGTFAPLPNNYRVLRQVDGLTIVELDLPSTLAV